LNKNGKPTDEEWRLIKRHPTAGFEELCFRDDLSWAQLMIVYQHHERLDGKGYPVGILGDEMHPWARICAVADVFDALTCERPYRKPLSVRDACQYLSDHAGTSFDQEMVRCWVTYTTHNA
jgi:HD-GYP domain-containing protein (c-di-GMP phosphodiesterase class II)